VKKDAYRGLASLKDESKEVSRKVV